MSSPRPTASSVMTPGTETLSSRCVWCNSANHHGAAYIAKVRIASGPATSPSPGKAVAGEGKAPTPGEAHELALKAAETDATKRALATFGNPFGLALYDRERLGVRRARREEGFPANWPVGPPPRHPVPTKQAFDTPSEVACALRKAIDEAEISSSLFATWEQNVETVRILNRSLKQDPLPEVRDRASAREPPKALRHHARQTRETS